MSEWISVEDRPAEPLPTVRVCWVSGKIAASAAAGLWKSCCAPCGGRTASWMPLAEAATSKEDWV